MTKKTQPGKRATVIVSDTTHARIKEDVKKATADFIRSIPDRVHNTLDGALNALLGITNKWGPYEVSHSDRNSVMTIPELVGKKARSAAKKLVDDIEFKPNNEIVQAVTKEFHKLVKAYVYEKLREKARQKAESILSNLVADGKTMEVITVSIDESKMVDPTYGKDDPLEEVTLESALESSMEEAEKAAKAKKAAESDEEE